MESESGALFPAVKASKEGQFSDCPNTEDPELDLVEEYKKKFACCIKALLPPVQENCKQQDLYDLELIFGSLVDDYDLLLKKFQEYETLAKQQIIKSNRKLEQEKALRLIGSGRQNNNMGQRENNLSPLLPTNGINEAVIDNNNSKLTRLEEELNKSHKQIKELETEVESQKTEVVVLHEKITSMTANYEDSKWALAKEVANKHDEVMNLQHKIATLENTLRETETQTHFKEDIIKTLRNEVKLLKERPKLCDVVSEVQTKKIKAMIPTNDDIGERAGQQYANPAVSVENTIEKLPGTHRSETCECSSKMANSTCVDTEDEKSRCSDRTETAVKHIDKILQGLSVEGNSNERQDEEDPLTSRIDLLQRTIFDVRLPELQSEIQAEKKLVANKEETVQNLHEMVKIRAEQAETFRNKVKELEQQLEQQKIVIGELQQAVQNCKQTECELHEKEISMLKFEICELEEHQKRYETELQAKTLEEKLRLKMQLKGMSNQLQIIEPQLNTTRRLFLKAEKYSAALERDLEARNKEIKELRGKVEQLEEEAEAAKDANDVRHVECAREISCLKENVRQLQVELSGIGEQYISLLDEADQRFAAYKVHASHQHSKLLEKNRTSESLIKQLQEKNQTLAEENHTKECHFRVLLGETQSLQRECDAKLGEAQNKLKQRELEWKEQFVKLSEKSNVLEGDLVKKTQILRECYSQIEESLKTKQQLQMQLKHRMEAIEVLRSQNRIIKTSLQERENQLRQWENGEISQLNRLESHVQEMANENSKLIAQRTTLVKELNEMSTIHQTLKAHLDGQTEFISKLSKKCGELDFLHQESQRAIEQEKDEKRKVEVQLANWKHKFVTAEMAQGKYDKLFDQHCEILEELKQVSRLNELVRQTEEEKKQVENERDELRKELAVLREEHNQLHDKLRHLNLSGQSRSNLAIDNQLDRARKTIVKYEEEIVPNLKFKMNRQEKIISALKTQVDEANQSCMRMRDEASQLIDSTDPFNRQRGKIISNPWSPSPPAAHTIWLRGSATSNFFSTPNRESPDCYESGFQSRGTSPSPQPE